MKLNNFKVTSKGLTLGLIITFFTLYVCVGFVSTLHSITFFHLANSIGLAVLLGLTYEVGQASVLFALLMTKNKDKFLPWLLMILLTTLQVTANVFASFRYMVLSGNNDWIYWQKSILFGFEASPEIYQVIISWIAGALLPIVALGMTALVAQNIKLATEEDENKTVDEYSDEEFEEGWSNLKKEEPKTYTEKEVHDFIDDALNDSGVITNPTPEFLKTIQSIDDALTKHKKEKVPIDVSQLEIDNENLQYLEKPETKMETVIKPLEYEIPIELSEKVTTKNLKDLIKKTDDNISFSKPLDEYVDDVFKLSTEDLESFNKGISDKEMQEIKVPKKRFRNPLKKKSKIHRIKNINEINPLSKGDEAIALIENLEKIKDKESINQPVSEVEQTHESILVPEILIPYIDGGVEVIDAKAVPKEKKNLGVDKFGIPIQKGEHTSFDRI